MNPGELFVYMLAGGILVVLLALIWLIFRKRKKIAVGMTIILLIGYVGFYFYSPTLKVSLHAESYEQLKDHLADTYPNEQFTISPQQYEAGHNVSEFQVNYVDRPALGVTLRVDDGEVSQISTWGGGQFPTQENLWQDIAFLSASDYTLDSMPPAVTLLDSWIADELTVFAVMLDDVPAIAVFNYSKDGYALVSLTQGDKGGHATAEYEGQLFVVNVGTETALTVSLNDSSVKEVDVAEQGQLTIIEI